MKDWQPIDGAPHDGSRVWVKRVRWGRVVAEGWAVFDALADEAPMRKWADGGRYSPIPPDPVEADVKRWSNPDRLHRFPTPTHWSPTMGIGAIIKLDDHRRKGRG